jgi:hypothetical protein
LKFLLKDVKDVVEGHKNEINNDNKKKTHTIKKKATT